MSFFVQLKSRISFFISLKAFKDHILLQTSSETLIYPKKIHVSFKPEKRAFEEEKI